MRGRFAAAAVALAALAAAGDVAARPAPTPRVMVFFPSKFSEQYAREQIRAIAERTPITAVHIDPLQARFLLKDGDAIEDVMTPGAVRFARAAAEEGRRHCVDVGYDLDWDRAFETYHSRHPDETFSKLLETETTLDSNGRATVEATAPPVIQRLASPFPAVRSDVHRAFVYTASGEAYVPASLADVTAQSVATPEGQNAVSVAVDAGAQNAGKSLFVLTRHEYRHPDVFSDQLVAFQREIVRHYRGTGIRLAGLDEMGLPNEPTEFAPTISGTAQAELWREPWFTPALAANYESRTGRDYEVDLLRQRVPPAGDPGAQTAAISAYYDELRAGLARLEREFYEESKRSLGPNTFVGVHPTWYGLYPSIFHYEWQRNGLDWWEAPRDIGQTDEGITAPIKLSLGRRWGGHITSNMVYSPREESLLDAAYGEARFNGRVDYNGSFGTDGVDVAGGIIVNTMKGNLPESIAEIEDRLALIDQVARALPRPRALVVFGYYGQADWTVSNPDGEAWGLVEPLGNTANSAAEIARALTDAGYVVDLVPSTEVDAGRVSTDAAGRATYAGQAYPAAVLAYPERSRSATLEWAGRVGNLGVVGDATTDAEGRPVGPAWAEIRSRARVALPGVPISPAPVIFQAAPYTPSTNPVARSYADRLATDLGLIKSAHPDGHELEDGTMLITDGSRYEGSTPDLDFQLDGHRVQAEGGEFFAIRLGPNGNVDRVAGDRIRSIRIDGRLAFRFDRAYDLALYREDGRWELAYSGAPPTDPFLASIPVGTPVRQLRCRPASAARKPRLRLGVRPRRVRAGNRRTFRVLVRTPDGRRVRRALVRFAGRRVRTNRRGRARTRITLRRARSYRVRASKRGFRPRVVRVRAVARRGA